MLYDNHQAVGGVRHPGDLTQYFDAGSNRMRHPDFIGARRPFIDDNGQTCVIVHNGRWTTEKGVRVPLRQKRRVFDLLNEGDRRVPAWVLHAASLRKEDWIHLDQQVLTAAREPLVAWADLAAASSFGGFNAYAKMTLEYEAMSDPGEAVVDMDGLSPARNDSPLFTLRSLPLQITHSDFWYSDRRLEVSGNSGTPLDSISGEAAGRRVAESIEDTTIGTVTGTTYGTQTAGVTAHEGASTVYGYTNFTYRATKTNLTTPTGANPQATVADVLDMIQTLAQDKYYGPFMLYCSLAWDEFMDNDYAFTNGSNWATNPSMTLRDRLRQIRQIQDVKTLPRLSTANSFVLLLVQLTSNVAQAIDGQGITTIQWESSGGLRQNFKVWAIQVPRLKAEYNQATGILHATTS